VSGFGFIARTLADDLKPNGQVASRVIQISQILGLMLSCNGAIFLHQKNRATREKYAVRRR